MAHELTATGYVFLACDGVVTGTSVIVYMFYALTLMLVLVSERTEEVPTPDSEFNVTRREFAKAVFAWWVVLPYRAWKKHNEQ